MADKDGVKGFHAEVGFGPSDRAEQKPLPLRIACVADWCAQGGQAPAAPVRIDAHEFDAVMARVAPRLVFECEGRLGAKVLEVDLALRSIKDFEPARVAAQLRPLSAVQAFIRNAEAVQQGTLSPADFKQDLAAYGAAPALRTHLDALLDLIGGAPQVAPAKAGEPEGGALDGAIASIFSMVDTGPRKTDGGAVDAAAAAIAGGGRFNLAGPIGGARAPLDAQLAAVIGHAGFRALEARWRGLHLLCRNGKAVQIELVHASEGEAAAAVESQLLKPEREGSSEAPVALLLCDIALPNSPEGNEHVQRLAELGEELQAPAVVALDAAFLGVPSMAALAALDAPAALFEQPAFDKWRSLRDKECARWLVAALNGFALRPPHTLARGGMDENPAGEEGVAWGSPVWLVGAAVARSFETTGWPSSHTGISDGEIPGLPVFDIPGRAAQFPLQAVFPDAHLKDLSRAGLVPVMCQANHDSAWLLQAPVVRRPSRAEEEGKLNTLAYALLAARVAASILHARGRLESAGDADRTQVNFEQFLDGLLSDTGPGAGAAVEVGAESVRLKLRVGRAILGGVELELAVPLRG